MPSRTPTNVLSLQDRLGYAFRDRRLLDAALTHRSYGPHHNERLEFLGDAALGLAIGALLYARGVVDEGRLSYWRSALVRAETLAAMARDLRLGSCLLLGEGEALSGGADRPSILADALEALLGAVFLDSGFDAVRGVVERLYARHLADLDPSACIKDAKTRLQEWLQARRLDRPAYTVTETGGHAHAQEFRVRCATGLGHAEGAGPNRRAAEQQAAGRLLDWLEHVPAQSSS